MYNAGCILPDKAVVQLIREEATRDGAVLVFDEVLSGFRMAPGGGQEYVGVTPISAACRRQSAADCRCRPSSASDR